MKHELFLLGKTKEKYIDYGINEYIKRLRRYTTFSVHNIKEKSRASVSEEAKLFRAAIPKKTYTVALDSRGEHLSSVEFSKRIEKWEHSNIKHISYLIGGSEGLCETITSEANFVLSLSKMTFTHDFARLIFVEQLYRGYTIKAGEKYHK